MRRGWAGLCALSLLAACRFDPAGLTGSDEGGDLGDDATDDGSGAPDADTPGGPPDASEPIDPADAGPTELTDASASGGDAGVGPPTDGGMTNPCPPDWTNGDDGRCRIQIRTARTWTASRDSCAALGGELASIGDAAENAKVVALTPDDDSWIGANDRQTEGQMRWLDGSGLTFSDWAQFQPDNYLFSEDCVEILDSGEWNDQDCGATRFSICERAAVAIMPLP